MPFSKKGLTKSGDKCKIFFLCSVQKQINQRMRVGMSFNSIGFLLFFPAVVLCYFALPSRGRLVFLLSASYLFYFLFTPEHILLLVATTFIDYWLAIKMANLQVKGQGSVGRKGLLIVGLINNIGMLFFFKYIIFFTEAFNGLLELFGTSIKTSSWKFILPVGISYFTFKKISYLVDVYRENQVPETHFGRFSLYVSFFPSVIAGPIDRAGSLLPQLAGESKFDYQRLTEGLQTMLWGFFKKMVIADNLAIVVNQVYNDPAKYEGIYLILATVFFSFQVYCDFSGYTDIAVGAAKILGFDLMENFNRPYHAVSIVDFWKRWHISLSTWLRDYLFLPIAFAISRRIKNPRLWKIKAETWAYIIGMGTTMLLCGIWHGAAWTFVLWGLIHGLFLVFSFVTKKTRKKLRKKLKLKARSHWYRRFRITVTFILITFAWIFFRARNVSDAFYIVSNMFNGIGDSLNEIIDFISKLSPGSLAKFLIQKDLGLSYFMILLVGLSMMIMETVHVLQRDLETPFLLLKGKSAPLRWSVYFIFIFWILIFGRFEAQTFIYLQF
jgi:alginate O-acetyltransferase complex protein AlgI